MIDNEILKQIRKSGCRQQTESEDIPGEYKQGVDSSQSIIRTPHQTGGQTTPDNQYINNK